MEAIERAEKNTDEKIQKKAKKLIVELMANLYEGGFDHAKEDIIKIIDGNKKISMSDLKVEIMLLKPRETLE